MEKIVKQLRISICSILDSVSKETVNDIIQAIKYAGLESLSDLQFVEEEDLILVLKPIPRRKLVKAWSEQTKRCNKLKQAINEEKVGSSSKENSVSPLNMAPYISDANSTISSTTTKSEDSGSKRSLENLETSKECDKIKQTIKEEKADFSSEVNLVAPPVSTFNVTTTMSASSVANSKAASITTQSEDSDNGRGLEDFETNEEDDLKYLLKIVTENKLDPLSKVGAPPISAFNTTTASATISAANSTSNVSITQSDCSEKEKKVEGSGTVISPAKEKNSTVKKPNKWTKQRCYDLLRVYAKFKEALSCPDVDEESVWKKIATEAKTKTCLYCDELECRNKVDELKSEYERIKNNHFTNRETAIHLDKTREILEASENKVKLSAKHSKSRRLQSCGKRDQEYHCTLLKVYSKFKTELDSPDVEVQEVWKKIAREMREIYFFDCGESLCRFDSFLMKCQYENFTKNSPNCGNKPYYYNEALEAFETAENLGKKFTVRVDNLSERVDEKDLENLFELFGPISKIHLDKDESGRNKGFAFISFYRREDASEALYIVNTHVYDNLILKVTWIGFSETDKFIE